MIYNTPPKKQKSKINSIKKTFRLFTFEVPKPTRQWTINKEKTSMA